MWYIQVMDENIYHIYNRGIEKRDIFVDRGDYIRFLNILCFFNDVNPVDFFNLSKGGSTSLAEVEPPDQAKKLVEILCFCLMPNHYHFILKSLTENGIANFMKKLGTGYTMYFNKKYQRSGHLFQGRYKHREINSEDGFMYLSGYIHLNHVIAKIVNLPEEYKYSSYLDFLGQKNYDFLSANKDFMDAKPEAYKKFVLELKSDKELFKKVEDVNIE